MGKKNPRHNNPEVKSQQTPRSLGNNKEEYGLEFSAGSPSKQFEIAAAQKYAKAEKEKKEGTRAKSKH